MTKKIDFSKLDLAKITGQVTEEKTEPKPGPKEGMWILGKDIKEITPEEFKEWLATLLPGTGVDKWEDKVVATSKDRERIVNRLGLTMETLFEFPRTTPKAKDYIN